MAKEKAYFWRGKGELKIDRLYVTGEKIPHTLMYKPTFDALLKDGDISETDFDVVESSTAVSALEKKVKSLGDELVKKNAKIASLEAELEEATKPAEKSAAGEGK